MKWKLKLSKPQWMLKLHKPQWMLKLHKPQLGWVLLVSSVFINITLLVVLLIPDKKHEVTKDQALLFALDRCNARLERYSEIKATADAYDKILENRRDYALTREN
jgi:hypothetical protein